MADNTNQNLPKEDQGGSVKPYFYYAVIAIMVAIAIKGLFF